MSTVYTINAQGTHYVRQFLDNHGKPGLKLDAYLTDAERAANDGFDREVTPVIELGRLQSTDGAPQTLVLEQAWFDADDAGDEEPETETWEAWLDGKRDEAVTFEVPRAGTFDVAQAGADALGVDVCEELNVARV